MAVYDDEQALDLAFAGQPFVQIGAADDTTLDLAYAGQPFAATGVGAGGPAVYTSQGQHASASASVTGVGLPTHRYWRLNITAATGTPHLDLTELEFRTAVGGVTQTAGGTPIYSNQSAGFEASKAFDANTGTSWYVNQSTYPLPQWIGYDFGAGNDKNIVEYALTCWNVNESPKDFQLQYSDDGTTWTTKDQRSGETWSATNQVKAYSTATVTSSTVTTSQGQSASAAGLIGPPAPLDATVTTSQAQHVVSIQPLDALAATSQGQQASVAAKLGIGGAATTAQAQSASAAGSAFTPWALIRRDEVDNTFGPSGADGFSDAMPASVVVAGNHILLAVQCDMAASITVSDTAGNVYTATLPIAFSDNSTHLQWFYSLNVTGHPANVITVSYSADVSGVGRYLTALHVQSPGPAAFDLLARNVTNTNSTTISAGPFNTAAAGIIVAAICSVNYDTESTWTNGMTFTTPRSTYFRGTGTRITSGPQTATSVGVTGSTVSSRRVLSAISVVDADPSSSGSTRQAQTTSASASAISPPASVAATTRQAQASSAQASLSAAGQGSTSQAQQASSQASAVTTSSAATSQGQSAGAQAGLAVDSTIATGAAQQVTASATLESTAMATGGQAQASTGALVVSLDAASGTSQAQQADAQVDTAFVLAVATSQSQQAAASGDVSVDAAAMQAQAQASSAEAGVAVDAVIQSNQRQRVQAQVRGESNNTVESGQRQSMAGVLGLAIDARVANRQGQGVAALVALAADSTGSTGQVQHSGDGNVVIVSVEASVTTGQERQHVEGELDVYLTRPGALSATSIRLRPALAGTVRFRATPDHTH